MFLGGLALALALNVYAILRIDVGREDGAIVGTVRFRVKLLNVAVIVVGSSLLVLLIGYAFLENFVLR